MEEEEEEEEGEGGGRRKDVDNCMQLQLHVVTFPSCFFRSSSVLQSVHVVIYSYNATYATLRTSAPNNVPPPSPSPPPCSCQVSPILVPASTTLALGALATNGA